MKRTTLTIRGMLATIVRLGLLLGTIILITELPPYEPAKMRMPEPWSYEFAAQNFQAGKWHLTYGEYLLARDDFRDRGTLLSQYVAIESDRWVFRQSPGFPLQLALFSSLGLPNFVNIVLTIASTLLLFAALCSLFDTQMAAVGIILFLWSPITLLSIHYKSMETFSGGAWLIIGGSLLVLLWQLSGTLTPRLRQMLTFVFGFAIGWAAAIRVTSMPLSILLLLGYVYLVSKEESAILHQRNLGDKNRSITLLLRVLARSQYVFLGLLVPIGITCFYNWQTFGRLLDSGYRYPSIYDKYNLWSEKAAVVVPNGVETWLRGGTLLDMGRTLLLHVILWLRPLTMAWPFWTLGVCGLILLWKRQARSHTTLLVTIWIFLAYAPFAGIVFFGVTRALSDPFNQIWGFFTPARYIYTLAFPYVITICYLLSQWPVWARHLLILGYVLLNTFVFWQTLELAYSLPI